MSTETTAIEEHAGCIWNGREVTVVHHGGLLGSHTEVCVDGETVATTPRWAFANKRASGSLATADGETHSLECDALWWGPVDVRIGGETIYRGVSPGAVKNLALSGLIGLVVGLFLGNVLGEMVVGMLF